MKISKNIKHVDTQLSKADQELWKTYTTWLFSNESKTRIRRIDTPSIRPTVLDLHGLTIQHAFDATIEFLNHHRKLKTKKVIIICGKSGQISKELKHWCNRLSFIRTISPNIDNRNGIGSYTITFYKKSL